MELVLALLLVLPNAYNIWLGTRYVDDLVIDE